jgi:hypothetical protein
MTVAARKSRIGGIGLCVAIVCASSTNGGATMLRASDASASSADASNRDSLLVGPWACQSVVWNEAGDQNWSTWSQAITRNGANQYASTEGPNTVTTARAPGRAWPDSRTAETRTYSTPGGARAKYSFMDGTTIRIEFLTAGESRGSGDKPTMPTAPVVVDIRGGLMSYGGETRSGGKYITRCKKE